MAKIKILVVTPRMPYPVIGGDRLRIFHICKALSELYDITLISLCDSREEVSITLPADGVFKKVVRVYLAPWRSRLNAIGAIFSQTPLQVAYYRSEELRTIVNEEIRSHDIALAHLVRTEEYIRNKGIPTIVEMTDAISLNYNRSKRVLGLAGFRPIIYSIEEKRLLKLERKLLILHNLLSIISHVDAEYLFGSPLPSKVVVCGNGVDSSDIILNFKLADGFDIAFIGNMSTMQNLDAVEWFASEVLPYLRQFGEFQLRVVGRISRKSRERLEAYEGIVVTGEVKSVVAASSGCFAAVCPMRIGAGIQNKVLEYLALGIPTVTSTIGLEGIDAKNGFHLLVADKATDVAQSLLRLKHEPELAELLSREGRALIKRSYHWKSILEPLVKAISTECDARYKKLPHTSKK
jgi:glycosyltransferase involved in cell wall biosynthesis